MKNHCVKLLGAVLSIAIVAILLSACTPGASSTTVAGNGPPLTPHGPTATIEINGVTMSMRVTPGGPYFLSELIAVDVSLTNHTQKAFALDGPDQAGPCGSALWVELDGGSAPLYMLPNATTHGCPWLGGTTVKPGQTLTIHQLLPLTASGDAMLKAGTSFLTTIIQQGERVTTDIPGPLGGHGSVIHLNIDSHIPAYRSLSLQKNGSQVFVTAPPAIRSHLLYLFNITCKGAGDSGTTWTGNFIWEPLPYKPINRPGCPGTSPQWEISVSAIGYAIASGSYH